LFNFVNKRSTSDRPFAVPSRLQCDRLDAPGITVQLADRDGEPLPRAVLRDRYADLLPKLTQRESEEHRACGSAAVA
jgi:hypothetical protein